MPSKKYIEQANNLAKAIDIAIEVIQIFPPINWEMKDIKHFNNVYSDIRMRILNPSKEFANLQSLKYSIDDIFIFFQETSGKAVDVFWKKVKEQNLPYNRENKIAKILKRGKIKDDIEYDFVVDTIVPYQQEGIISPEEAEKLSKMIHIFEKR